MRIEFALRMNVSVIWATVFAPYRWLILALPLVLGCSNGDIRNTDQASMSLPPTKMEGSYQVMIETGLGAFVEHTYDLTSQKMEILHPIDTTAFLPLPINLGFIPVGQLDQLKKIPTWVVGKHLDPGLVISVVPLGLLKYEESGLDKEVVVAVPKDRGLKTIPTERFQTFIIDYDPLKFNIAYWLRHRHGLGSVTSISWEDEIKALEYLETNE